MSLQDQIDLLPTLGTKGIELPGLTLDEVLDNLALKQDQIKQSAESYDEEAKETVERGELTEEEAEKQADEKKEKMISDFKESSRYVISQKISVIKQNMKIVTQSAKTIALDVKDTIESILIPPAISAPPSTPNPAYALKIAKRTKNNLTRTLSIAIAAFAILLKLSIDIKYELPTSVLDLMATLDKANAIISSIPV